MHTIELLKHIGIEISGTELPDIIGIALKAAEVKPGYLFVALKGAQKDGADFIPEAIQNGAVVALAERQVSADIPVLVVPDLRRRVSRLAALMYPSDQIKKLAITGTNGKTSTVYYVQQILNQLGIPTASMGTIGIDRGQVHEDGSMTTPDAVTLNQNLNRLQAEGIRVVAMEASSHGLDQGRLDGLMFEAGGLTNLTQDHLDYHKTMEAYLEAKAQLFKRYIGVGKYAVLNADDPCFSALEAIAKSKGEVVISYGRQGVDLTLVEQKATADGQEVVFRIGRVEYRVKLAIVGDFQVMNVLAAMGLCRGVGISFEQIIPLLSELKAPTGRIEQMGVLPNGAQIFVDYAHTPDAVERVLQSLRAHTKGKLVCLMGCGGNRDTTKRPLMGSAAAKLADVVYITDDNPRFEKPAEIRAAIKAACPDGIECDNREEAIHRAISNLGPDDVLVLAGKGHEPGQTINGVTYAMDDRIEARLAILNRTQKPIWNSSDLGLALSVKVAERIQAYGVSIDTRTVRLGDLFIALKGDKTDGHAYVKKAVESGAAVCVVSHLVEQVPPEKQIVVSDTMEALNTLAKFSRMRSHATFIGVTGSSGKTTTKEMLKACLSEQGKTHATAGNFNNQIGVPLTLATLPPDTRYAIVEMGMNHSGELMSLSNMVRPDITIITSIGLAHREFFKSEQDIATAKSEIFDYQNRQGTVVLNRDSEFYEFLKKAAQGQGLQHILTFGQSARADFCLTEIIPDSDGMQVHCKADSYNGSFRLHFFGQHFAMDALGVLAVVQAVGARVDKAVGILETIRPTAGRGAEVAVQIGNRSVVLLDDAYNANPSSMTASIRAFKLRQGHRKIAVLGDMLELGDMAEQLHIGLAKELVEAGIDRVYTVGPLMAKMRETLPTGMQGTAAQQAKELLPVLKAELENGDVVLIKASHGTGLSLIIRELKGK